jgi:hypothetical protein
VLFFRVLGRPDGALRIELWERGEYHGERTLTGAGEKPQLVARRVALAAAELGRRLARKREAQLSRESRLRQNREALAREQQQRTQDGPLALRSEVSWGNAAGPLRLLGPRLSAELSLVGPLRLDLSAEWLGGSLEPAAGPSLPSLAEGVGLGPAYRLPLGRSWDLDGGLRATALLLQVPSATSLDGLVDQDSAWTARLEAGARLQLRLTRQLRLSLGGELGGLLRSVHYSAAGRAPERLRGLWWGAGLGVVVTPRR